LKNCIVWRSNWRRVSTSSEERRLASYYIIPSLPIFFKKYREAFFDNESTVLKFMCILHFFLVTDPTAGAADSQAEGEGNASAQSILKLLLHTVTTS